MATYLGTWRASIKKGERDENMFALRGTSGKVIGGINTQGPFLLRKLTRD